MANIVIPFAAVTLQPVPSVGFNNNFTEIANKFNTYAVQTDVAKTISVAHTFSVAQTMVGLTLQGDVLFTDALYDIGKSAATRPRDLFLSRNLTVGNLATIGGAQFNANIAPTTGAGVEISYNTGSAFGLIQAFDRTGGVRKPLHFAGDTIDMGGGGNLDWHFTNGRLITWGTSVVTGGSTFDIIIPNNVSIRGVNAAGTNSFSMIRVNASDLIQIDQGGLGATFAGNVSLSAATARIIGGSNSIAFRDSTNAFDNLLVTNAGVVTVRSQLNVSQGGIWAPQNGATNASINIPHSAAPPSITVTNGDLWTTTAGLFVKINGANKTVMLQTPSTGYAAFTNTVNRGTVYDTTTVTLAQLASRVAAIQADLTTQNILSA